MGHVKERGYYSAHILCVFSVHVNHYTAYKAMKLTNLHLTKFGLAYQCKLARHRRFSMVSNDNPV